MKTLPDFDFRGKRVLVRCDFNVPLGNQGEILDDFRIKATLPTIKYLLEKKAKVILMSHLGRPEGKQLKFGLGVVQKRLAEYLEVPVIMASDCIGFEVEKQARELGFNEILLLENLRFHKEEEAGCLEFAKELSKLGDIYINDAFGASHRAHASISGAPQFLPSGAGPLLMKEIEVLTQIIENPRKPLLVIIGGAKIETKVQVIEKISKVADCILISGLIQKEIREKNIAFSESQKIAGPIDEIEGKDVGPQTVLFFEDKILQANTIFWNGPLGQIEKEEFADGTECIARFIGDATGRAFTVIGGGETVEFAAKLGLIEKYNHVSTGGGAMLEFLAGDKLPGITALE